MRGYGLKDGSKVGWKLGGRGRNKTSVCRHPNKNELVEDKVETESMTKRAIRKIMG